MDTREISENDWLEFVDQFSRDHVGWLTRITVLDPQRGPQDLATDAPLQGISFDTRGTRPSSLQISVGRLPEQHVNHIIDKPLHIREAAGEDAHVDLQIEPATGPITLLSVSGPR
jgi:hypothetical protein